MRNWSEPVKGRVLVTARAVSEAKALVSRKVREEESA